LLARIPLAQRVAQEMKPKKIFSAALKVT
jgi:hypothetical protein